MNAPDDISPILGGKICPYRNGQTEFIDSKVLDNKRCGMIYLCRIKKKFRMTGCVETVKLIKITDLT
jgi:hypothetical protein